MTDTPKPAEDQQPQRTKEAPKPKGLLIGLAVLLVISAIAGFIYSNFWQIQTQTPEERWIHSLQQADKKGTMSFDFVEVIEVSSGVGLSEWLDPIPSKAQVLSVKAPSTATYFIDPHGEWNFKQDGSKVEILAPVPELKSVRIDPTQIQVATDAAPFPDEDRSTMMEILKEQLPRLARQQEDARVATRRPVLREKIQSLVAVTLGTTPDHITVFFHGEGAAIDLDGETPVDNSTDEAP